MDCDLIDQDNEQVPNQLIIGSMDSNHPTLGELTKKIGNYEKLGSFHVVSYYQRNSASKADLSKLELYEEKEGLKISSSIALPFTVRHTSSVMKDNLIFTTIVTNEGLGSSLRLAFAKDGKYYKKTVSIDDYSLITKAHVFLSDKTPQSEEQINLIVITYSEVDQVLGSFKFEVLFNPRDFSLVIDEVNDSSNPIIKIKEYDYVTKDSVGVINFYVVTNEEIPKVGRITFTKSTGEFTNDYPLKRVNFEADASKEQLIYSVGCSKISLESENGIDRCAFSTFGAVVYYVEMENTDEGVKTNLNQQPAIKKVNVKKMLRLRRNFFSFGKNVFVLGDFVVMESEKVTNQSQVALVWDVDDYEDSFTGDVAINQIINLTMDGSSQNIFNPVIINALVISDEKAGSYEFDLIVLNQSRDNSQPKLSVGQKRLSKYIL